MKTKPCLTLEDWPIMVNGECAGAVGVLGVPSHEDEQIANAGIAVLG